MGKTKKKNKWLVLIILLIVAVAAVSAYFIIKGVKNGQTEPEETGEGEETGEEIVLSEHPLTEIKSFSFSKDADGYTIEKAGSVWKLVGDEDFEVDQSVADVIASELTTVKAKRLLEKTRVNFPKYGLGTPQMIVRVFYTDGTEVSLAFGDYNDTVDAYYVNVFDTYNVYLFGDEIIEALDRDKEYFRAPEESGAEESAAESESAESVSETEE